MDIFMVFSSLTFLVCFFPVVLLLYFICKNMKYRNAVLIVFSLLFYAWGEPKWIAVMLLTVGINYLCGLIIVSAKSLAVRRVGLFTGIIVSLGFLVYFKYTGFLLDSVSSLLSIEHLFVAPVLPIGISFYTFQVLTYTVDVYCGKTSVQKSFFRLLLYVSFFPQLIAGPIVNYSDIEKYLKERTIRFEDFYQGMLRFLVGFSKKILLANTCGEITQQLQLSEGMSVLGAWIMAIAYTFQIYFDFSGYSDMAIGMGRMFGFHFLENFNYPYLSKSVTEFWRRWHISLGTFFRDYVYIPLGGNRVSRSRWLCNILIVWMLTGIWHGASWNFLLWGVYYGVLLILEKMFLLKIKETLPSFVNVVVTLFFVIIGWMLFYYVDAGQALTHIGRMFGVGAPALPDPKAIYFGKKYLGFLILAALACVPWKQYLRDEGRWKNSMAVTVGKLIAVTVMALIAFGFLVGQSYNPFLYFRF